MKGTAIITGASRGIGAACARLAAARGYAVVVNYRHAETAARAICEEITAGGGRAVPVRADVANESEVVSMFERATAELGAIRALVNNAGVLFRQSRLDEMDGARIAAVMAVNATGSLLCAREAVRRMSTRHGGGGGAIVNVSSGAARLGAPDEYIDYAASKGAVDTLTVGLAREVAAEGIRVNAVRPGLIRTDIHASGGEPGRVDRLAPQVPMQRGGEACEVACTVLWLLSEEASYVTGAIVDVTGGR
jgi:NAD(P)-dependent dehydrogenase (short-subunit alcohol dehydrogenase family)